MRQVKFSIIVVTYQRDDALERNIKKLLGLSNIDSCELILIDNNEDEKSREIFLSGFSNAVYQKSKVNLGVSGGRNIGICLAKGRFLIFIDDDATFSGIDVLDVTERIFENRHEIGAIAFRSKNYYTGTFERMEIPHTNKSLNLNKEFYTFRYIGVGHAIRQSVFEDCGLYIDDFFYGGEEFEFSYRMIKRGWKIKYSPRLEVIHEKLSSGRLSPVDGCERRFLNQLKINYLHLPFGMAFLNTVAWATKTLIDTRCRANMVAVTADFCRWVVKKNYKRTPLGRDELDYIRECGGQLWK